MDMNIDGNIISVGAGLFDAWSDQNQGKVRCFQYKTLTQTEWESCYKFDYTNNTTYSPFGTNKYYVASPLIFSDGDSTNASPTLYKKYWIQIGNDVIGHGVDEMYLLLSLYGPDNDEDGPLKMNGDGTKYIVGGPKYNSNSGYYAVWSTRGFDYTGDESKKTVQEVNGVNYNFYYGDISMNLFADFGEASLRCSIHGYMGGENILKYRKYWNQVGGTLHGTNLYAQSDYFGSSVKLNYDGTKIAIGAANATVTTGSTYSALGYVRVFEYDETSSLNINVDNQNYGPNKWKRLGPDLNPDNSELQNSLYYGNSVKISNDGYTVAVGITGSNKNGARVYKYNPASVGLGSWNQLGEKILADDAGNKQGGKGLSLNHDGSIVAISCPSNDEHQGDKGKILMYQYRTVTQNEWDTSNRAMTQTSSSTTLPILLAGADSARDYPITDKKYWIQICHDASLNQANTFLGGSPETLKQGALEMSQDGTQILAGGYHYANNDHGLAVVFTTRPINYFGDSTKKVTKQFGDISMNYYYGDVVVDVYQDFTSASVHCSNHGYMGGQNILNYYYDSWDQRGGTIYGARDSEILGHDGMKLNDDGTIIAISAARTHYTPTYSISSHDLGSIRVFKYRTLTQDEWTAGNKANFVPAEGVSVIVDPDNTYVAGKKYWIQIDDIKNADEANATTGLHFSHGGVGMSSDGTVISAGSLRSNGNVNTGYAKVFSNRYVFYSGDDYKKQVKQVNDVSYNFYYGTIAANINQNFGTASLHSFSDATTGTDMLTFSNDEGWVQLGGDIPGEAANTHLGERQVSISHDGTVIAFGMYANNSSRGAIRMFKYRTLTQEEYNLGNTSNFTNNLTEASLTTTNVPIIIDPSNSYVSGKHYWVQLGQDIQGGTNENLGVHFGFSKNGTKILAGTWNQYPSGTYTGRAQIFGIQDIIYAGDNYNKLIKQVNDVSYNFYYGDVVVNVNNDFDKASLYCYNHGYMGGENMLRHYYEEWAQVGGNIEGEAASDLMGYSTHNKGIGLNSDGTLLIVGLRDNDGNGENSGSVRIFNYRTLTQQEYNAGNSTNTTGYYNQYIIIDPSNTYVANKKYWVQIGNDLDGAGGGDDKIGDSLSISKDGTKFIIGSERNDYGANNAGYAQVYEIDSNKVFAQSGEYLLDISATLNITELLVNATTDANSSVNVGGTVIATRYNALSDARFKKNIQDLQNPLETVNQMRGVKYNWKYDTSNPSQQLGLIAQEIEQILPSLITKQNQENEHGFQQKSIDYNGILPYLIESVKELYKKNKHLKQKIDYLENKTKLLT